MPNRLDHEGEAFADLTLTETELSHSTFSECTFTRCVFDRCAITQCSFRDCRFDHCRILSPRVKESQAKSCTFTDCCVQNVNWSELLPPGRFADPIESLERCSLKYNTFTEMNLAHFRGAGNDIAESMFARCRLSDSCFTGCQLRNTEFYGCDLTKADFRDATGYRIDIASNKLKGARFSYPEVVSLLDGLGLCIE